MTLLTSYDFAHGALNVITNNHFNLKATNMQISSRYSLRIVFVATTGAFYMHNDDTSVQGKAQNDSCYVTRYDVSCNYVFNFILSSLSRLRNVLTVLQHFRLLCELISRHKSKLS